jgi:hypothetical protein
MQNQSLPLYTPQGIMVAYRIYMNGNGSIPTIETSLIYLRNYIPFNSDCLGINWEISKNTITALFDFIL